jgi:hypothetical protein
MRIRKRMSVLVATGIAVLLGATGASAITNGQPDGDNHPYVGLMVALDADGIPMWRCSGSLLSPTVFLTAGHCTEPPAAHVEIWFDTGPIPLGPGFPAEGPNPCDGVTGYPCTGDVGGVPHASPDFCIGCGNGLPGFATRDVGVVVLDDAVPASLVSEYADLPAAGQADTLRNKTAIDLVGYGVQFQAKIPGNLLPQPPPFFRWTGPRTRMYATSELVAGNFVHSAEFLRLSANPGGGKGSTCFGDSGGPNLLGGTDIVLGVTSYGADINCASPGYAQRVDVPEVLDWINGFLGS